MDRPKHIGLTEALRKIKHFCGYQERTHAETKDKLYSYGLYKTEVEETIAQLIEEDYLNEERFATAFASGRFRLKQWGRVKIKYELQQKRISPYCITQALAALDDNDYAKTIEQLADKKLATLKSEKNIFTKKTKLRNYLLQKGYEHAVIAEVMNKKLG